MGWVGCSISTWFSTMQYSIPFGVIKTGCSNSIKNKCLLLTRENKLPGVYYENVLNQAIVFTLLCIFFKQIAYTACARANKRDLGRNRDTQYLCLKPVHSQPTFLVDILGDHMSSLPLKVCYKMYLSRM